jgi:hypothetical protein
MRAIRLKAEKQDMKQKQLNLLIRRRGPSCAYFQRRRAKGFFLFCP